jgi:hypothetical protein
MTRIGLTALALRFGQECAQLSQRFLVSAACIEQIQFASLAGQCLAAAFGWELAAEGGNQRRERGNFCLVVGLLRC